jgi:hypothetical protein
MRLVIRAYFAMASAYQGVGNGFRYCFQKLGTDLLCINTLGGRSLDAISLDLKSGKGQYESDLQEVRLCESQQGDSAR